MWFVRYASVYRSVLLINLTCHLLVELISCKKYFVHAMNNYGVILTSSYNLVIHLVEDSIKRNESNHNDIAQCTVFRHLFWTHLPLDKLTAISQTIFSDAFSWMNNQIYMLFIQRPLVLHTKTNKYRYIFYGISFIFNTLSVLRSDAPLLNALTLIPALISNLMPWIGVYHGEMDVIQWTW